MLFPTIEAGHFAYAHQVTDDELGCLFLRRIQLAATLDVVGQCPQPELVAVGLKSWATLPFLAFLLAQDGQPGGHHVRTIDIVVTNRLKRLVDAMLVSQQS